MIYKIKRNLKPFFVFSFIGIINTLIHISILYILTEYFEVYYLLASFIGFIFAVTNSFTLNTILTFKQKIKYKTKLRYSKFLLVSLTAALVNLFLLYIITEFFKVYYLLSQLIATFFSLIINFSGNKKWTYN